MQEQPHDKDSSNWTGNGQAHDKANREARKRVFTIGGIACVLTGALGRSVMMGHWIIGGVIALVLLSLAAYSLGKAAQ